MNRTRINNADIIKKRPVGLKEQNDKMAEYTN